MRQEPTVAPPPLVEKIEQRFPVLFRLVLMVYRAYRFRIYPTAEQETVLRQTFGSARWVWNTILAEQRARTARGEQRLSYRQTSLWLTAIKRQPEHGWLNDVSSVALQQVLRHLARAHENWNAGRSREPAFKRKRNGRGAAQFTRSGFQWNSRRRILTLAKIGPLRVRWSRPLPGGCEPSTVTVTCDAARRTFVSILVDQKVAPMTSTEQITALDLGLSTWVTTAQGEKVANPRHYVLHERQLAHAQRALNRKRKFSHNWEKARMRVARVHARIADARRDDLHKLTTRIVSENQAIALERLPVRGMVRNRSLAKAISDASWSELVRQVKYKAEWYGRRVIQACRWFPSSKRCSACGEVREHLSLEMRNWTCVCGAQHDRDVNAAENLLTLLATTTPPTCRGTHGGCLWRAGKTDSASGCSARPDEAGRRRSDPRRESTSPVPGGGCQILNKSSRIRSANAWSPRAVPPGLR